LKKLCPQCPLPRKGGGLSVFLVLCIALTSGCASSALRSRWRHQILESGRETSLEYREEGLLFYQGRLVPDSFSAIVCPIGSFVYRRPPALIASSSGWQRDAGGMDTLSAAKAPAPSGAAFSADEAMRGWYPAPFSGRKKGTPASWIWAEFKGAGYWIKPEGVFVYAARLRPLP